MRKSLVSTAAALLLALGAQAQVVGGDGIWTSFAASPAGTYNLTFDTMVDGYFTVFNIDTATTVAQAFVQNMATTQYTATFALTRTYNYKLYFGTTPLPPEAARLIPRHCMVPIHSPLHALTERLHEALFSFVQRVRLPVVDMASSTSTGAWSLGRSFLRGALSMRHPVARVASAALTRMWSMRSPWFLRNARLR